MAITDLTASRPTRKDFARFFAKIRVNPVTGCWEWQGAKTPKSYGTFNYKRKTKSAHVLSYLWFVGDIPDARELDHVCRNRSCAAPHHLEPVTHPENILRGVSPAAINKRKTHCNRGHAFTEDNTYYTNSSHRHCRTCQLEYHRVKHQTNGDGIRQKMRERHHANKAKHNRKSQEYRRKHLIELRAKACAKRAADPEFYREKERLYRLQRKDAINARKRRNYREKQAKVKQTQEVVESEPIHTPIDKSS